MNSKIGLIIALITTVVIGVYGIELSIRVSVGSGRPEYLVVVLIVLALLLLVDWHFYRGYIKDKKKQRV